MPSLLRHQAYSLPDSLTCDFCKHMHGMAVRLHASLLDLCTVQEGTHTKLAVAFMIAHGVSHMAGSSALHTALKVTWP